MIDRTNMDSNLPIWGYYQPGFIDPLYRPYVRTAATDNKSNIVSINRSSYTPLAPSGPNDPGLLRKGWGLRFQLLHPDDPCPTGFSKGEDGYCYRHYPEFEPVFYSDKAFLARNQFWGGFVDSKEGSFGTVPNPPEYRPSSSFDMRSVDPLNGNFHIYFRGREPKKNHNYSTLRTSDCYV